MRILFAGSPQFAVPSLETVYRAHEVAGVLTNPDRPAGRSGEPARTPVKARALELGLEVLQPERLDEAFRQRVSGLGCELLVVAACGRIFPKEFLDLLPRGGFNVHPSLLPRHRGPAPIAAAILAGDPETGVSIQRLAPKMDSGDILRAQALPLSGTETAGSLSEILGRLGAELLGQTLADIQRGRAQARPQPEEAATYCRLVRKEDGRIDWGLEARAIERMIRAYDPWPGAFTTFHAQRLNLLAGGVYPEPRAAGSGELPQGLVQGCDNRYGILVQAGRGILFVTRLQLQSKKPMDWRAFLNGQRGFTGTVLGVDDV